jgi:hypothetical protein
MQPRDGRHIQGADGLCFGVSVLERLSKTTAQPGADAEGSSAQGRRPDGHVDPRARSEAAQPRRVLAARYDALESRLTAPLSERMLDLAGRDSDHSRAQGLSGARLRFASSPNACMVSANE